MLPVDLTGRRVPVAWALPGTYGSETRFAEVSAGRVRIFEARWAMA